MAINDSPRPAQLLNVKAGRWAGAISAMLSVAGIGAILSYLGNMPDRSVSLTVAGAAIIVFLVITTGASVRLIQGRTWAQRFLLTVYLGILVGVVSIAAATLLWKSPAWWEAPFHITLVLVPAGAVIILAVLLLVEAAATGSRLRYATYVGISIAAAMALMIAVNMLAQVPRNYIRRDAETLGRYSLSERTKRILEPIKESARLTCVYTAMDDPEATRGYRQRVMELLREMHEQNRNIEFANVTSDTGKAKLVGRLRGQLSAKAKAHDQVLKDFYARVTQITDALKKHQQTWETAAGRSYLDMWGLTAEVARILKTDSKAIEDIAAKVHGDLQGTGLVDYGKLIEEVVTTLNIASENLQKVNKQLELLGKIPPGVKANRPAVLETADQSIAVVTRISDAIGKAGDDPPADPADALKKLVDLARQAARQVNKTARELTDFAGEDCGYYVRNSQAMLVEGGGGPQLMLPDGQIVTLGRATLPDAYRNAGVAITDMKESAQRILQAAKSEYQLKSIEQYRKATDKLINSLTDARGSIEKALDRLEQVDETTQGWLEKSKEDKLFAKVTESLTLQLKAISNLPELPKQTLATDITTDNIVVAEAGGKAEVINFESVWPLKVPLGDSPQPDQIQRRAFAGDSAISSRILSMTADPFATVLLTHYKPNLPPRVARALPAAEISPRNLSELRRRLEGANFEVKNWNLDEELPSPEGERPQVLMVLPPQFVPPIPMGEEFKHFGDEHMEKIRNAIDDGVPAIFLTQFFWPRQLTNYTPPASPPYQLSNYLKGEWGIDARTNFLVTPAVPDETHPGKFKIDPYRFAYLPLNTFSTKHPIGEPLQGQRTFWRSLCPILTTSSPPKGVSVQSLLEVPQSWSTTWATGEIMKMVRQFQQDDSGFVSPNYEGGDLPAPFDVAVAGVREGSENVNPSRIVVLGLGAGFVDGYLDQRIGVLNPDRTIALTDPPRTNADLLVNSVYWLVGRDRYIARGPAKIQPVAMIPQTTVTLLWISCVIALPLLIVALGGAVMLLRRR
ncbi:MAG: DUF7088 domain-containing protein [Planctomycetota bacterium]|jgi:methyl-accepting chemotaxis protein